MAALIAMCDPIPESDKIRYESVCYECGTHEGLFDTFDHPALLELRERHNQTMHTNPVDAAGHSLGPSGVIAGVLETHDGCLSTASIVGENIRFGCGVELSTEAASSLSHLNWLHLAEAIAVTVAPPAQVDGEVVEVGELRAQLREYREDRDLIAAAKQRADDAASTQREKFLRLKSGILDALALWDEYPRDARRVLDAAARTAVD